MSQHDMDLANAAGASFRSDANAALLALVSNSSGAAAPSTTFACMWWADTTTHLLKRRNEANSGWITVMDLTTGLIVGTDVQAYDAATAKTNAAQAFSKAQRGAVVSLSDGATITPDFSLGNNFAVAPSLGGNRTLANPTNLVAGQSGVVYLPQDGTGSRTLTLGWGWPSAGVTLSTVAGTVDALAYYVAAAASATVTISNATPGVVTWNGHGLLNGQKIQLTTTGGLPTGLSPSTTYYVKWVDANTFQLSATIGGASIATSSAGSGVHTCTAVTIQASLTKGVM